jgi:Uma2 family endonuclease
MSKSKLCLTSTDDGVVLARDEFAEADSKGPWLYERRNGRLVVMVPPGFGHHRSVKFFRNHLGAYELSHPEIVEDVFQESWIYVDEDTDRIPDIAVYLHGTEGAMPERVPDLIFEVVSKTADDRRRDYDEKRAEYERLGVSEYVIVDRFEHRVTVLTLQDGVYDERVFAISDDYTSPLLPGLAIPLNGVI